MTAPTPAQIVAYLRAANAIAAQALAAGHHPFGAVLVAADHSTVLLRQGNVDAVNHAEAVLAREAARLYPPDVLWGCTLYTTVEPCAMCAGTQYWAHIGRVVYGMAESRLLAMTGNHAENPTLDLPCRDLFARGQKAIDVIGPVPAVEAEIAALHQDFWRRSGTTPPGDNP
jgi:tRNA(Arg) A34 adenosine deaminase TadA